MFVMSLSLSFFISRVVPGLHEMGDVLQTIYMYNVASVEFSVGDTCVSTRCR